jgi:hypothetical protein
VAVLLTWALFLGWTAIGLAVLNAAGLRNGTRKLLLAPALGVVPAAVLAYTGVKLGFTVRESGPAIGIAVLLFALVVLWLTRGPRARVLVVARRQLPFAGVLVAAFALTAWPMFKYGFDWVANGNDDYANYCLGATGFRDHGYLRQPTEAELLAQQDATLPLWYLYFDDRSPRETRCGSELVLALVSTWTGLAPQQAFMPVVASFHLALVSAAAGLVLAFTRRRAAALATAGLLAVSSELTYGFLQQLIAQAVGLALLCAALALLRLPVRRVPYGALARRALAGGAACAGLLLFYPELIPLFVGAAVLLGARDLVLRRPVRRHLWHAGAAVAVMALALPAYLVGATHFLLFQAAHGAGGSEIAREVFPYFLTPRGPALVSGLLPLYANLPEPLHTAVLVAGALGLLAELGAVGAQFRRGQPFAALVLVAAVLGALLYRQGAGFGLFKLAMFVQPFLWAAVVACVAARGRRGAVLVGVVLVCTGALNARTQAWYVRESLGADSRVYLPAATRHRALGEFRAALAARAPVERVVLATENNVLSKLLSAEVRTPALTQLGMYPMKQGDDTGGTVRDPLTRAPLHTLWHAPAAWRDTPPDRALLVAGVGGLSVLNRQQYPETGPALLCAPLSEVRNFAAFRDATGARQNFLGMGTVAEIALNQIEPDPALRHRTFAGVGRAVVVEVLNPDPMVRAVVSYTATYLPDADARAVPAIRVVGADRVHLPRAGSGAARLVSPPVAPQAVGRAGVLVLEIDKPLARNPNQLSGLEALWGADVPRDRRHLAGHLRELSLISEEEYAGFRPPERLAKIPADFAHPHIEFSGFLEDGWVERGALVRLTRPAGDRDLVIRGHCPGHDPNFRPELTVLVDGSPVLTRALEPGEFELRAPAGSGTGPKWVELRFDRTTRLPAPDHRPASALVRTVGFEPPAQPEGTARR